MIQLLQRHPLRVVVLKANVIRQLVMHQHASQSNAIRRKFLVCFQFHAFFLKVSDIFTSLTGARTIRPVSEESVIRRTASARLVLEDIVPRTAQLTLLVRDLNVVK